MLSVDCPPSHPDRLQDLLAFLAVVGDPLPGTVSYWDRDQRCLFANPAFREWYGLVPAQMLGHTISELLGPALASQMAPHVAGALAGELQRFERVVDKGGGRTCHVLGHYVPHELDGTVVGFVALATDVSDHRAAEAELRELTQTLENRVQLRTAALKESEERFRQVFEGAPVAILGLDPRGRVTLTNPVAERLFGAGADRPVEALIPGGVVAGPGWGRRPDGSAFPIEIAPSSMRIGDALHVLAFVSDLTQTRRLAEERERMLVHAQKLESLGVLAGGIAHDFNNLLTGVIAHASLLGEDRSLESGRESLAEILASARRAADLCHQLLAFAGHGQFTLRPADLTAEVEGSAALLHTSIRQGVDLRLELAPDLPRVEVDPDQIRQLLLNLVLNAVEAVGPTGRVVVRTGMTTEAGAVVVGDAPAGPAVFLEVEDDGRGIEPADLQRIFDPFFTTKFTGRGLGLSAVQGIVRGHRAALAVRTGVGAGTAFRVLLRARPDLGETPAPAAVNQEWSGSGVVLLADDESTVRNVVRRALARLGFEVDAVEDGEQAVERFRQDPGRFALVVLDLTMPRMTGVEALREIRRLAPAARVLLMSGYSGDDLGALDQQPSGFLHKPFDVRSLVEAVRAAVQG